MTRKTMALIGCLSALSFWVAYICTAIRSGKIYIGGLNFTPDPFERKNKSPKDFWNAVIMQCVMVIFSLICIIAAYFES